MKVPVNVIAVKPGKVIIQLNQCAKSAKSSNGSYFKAQFHRLVVWRGKNRAVVAVAHSMLIAIYYMLKNKEHFKDLGEDYYNQFNTKKKLNHYVKQIKKLGYTVTELIPTPVNS